MTLTPTGGKKRVSKSLKNKKLGKRSKSSKLFKKSRRMSRRGGNNGPPPAGSYLERQTLLPNASSWLDGGLSTNILTSSSSDPVLVTNNQIQDNNSPFPDLKNIDPTTKNHVTPDRLMTEPDANNIGEEYSLNLVTDHHQPVKNSFMNNDTNFKHEPGFTGGSSNVGARGYTVLERLDRVERKINDLTKHVKYLKNGFDD
tara:strand:- start:172 stop:771 length:600 start_codon:yes stop_codon:yes gene_type:complete